MKIRNLIIDLINEYDEQGYILTEKIVNKYEKRINNLNTEWTVKEGKDQLKINLDK